VKQHLTPNPSFGPLKMNEMQVQSKGGKIYSFNIGEEGQGRFD